MLPQPAPDYGANILTQSVTMTEKLKLKLKFKPIKITNSEIILRFKETEVKSSVFALTSLLINWHIYDK